MKLSLINLKFKSNIVIHKSVNFRAHSSDFEGKATALCKSNKSEVRWISSFVLTHEFSLNDTKFRGYLCEISCLRKRNFGLAKLRRSENSRLRNLRKTNFRDTVYDAHSLNLTRRLKTGIALNHYTVGSQTFDPSIAGVVHLIAFCDKFHKITTLVDNDLLRIL